VTTTQTAGITFTHDTDRPGDIWTATVGDHLLVQHGKDGELMNVYAVDAAGKERPLGIILVDKGRSWTEYRARPAFAERSVLCESLDDALRFLDQMDGRP